MKFKKSPKELFDFIDFALRGYNCECKKMFGGIGYFVNGNMFTGVSKDDLFLRLPEEDRKLIMQEYDEVSIFEPIRGKRMAEYVAIPESVFTQPNMLDKWLDKSYSYVSTLPEMQKKWKEKGSDKGE